VIRFARESNHAVEESLPADHAKIRQGISTTAAVRVVGFLAPLCPEIAERCQQPDYGHSRYEQNKSDPANSAAKQTGEESDACRQKSNPRTNKSEPSHHGMIVRTLGRSHPDNGGSDASDHGAKRNNGRAESHKRREVPTVEAALSPAAYEASYHGDSDQQRNYGR
jgi:hypothetical protein